MSGQKCRADEPSASGWSAWAWLVLSLWVVAPRAFAAPPDALPVVGLHTTIGIERAEAAPSGWEAASPPVTGWVPVRLPDDWNSHWPGHDGVVWYRLRWLQADARQPVGLMIDYTHLAAAVYVNGGLIERDPSLVEPLTRGWITARYELVSAPLLREGENELLVRVSGLDQYEPGMGAVLAGDPAIVREHYERDRIERLYVKLVNLAISAALGMIFLFIWLLRRSETTFGWFALFELTGSLYRYNLMVEDPWPFTSSDGWQAFVSAMKLVSAVSWTMFLLRYGGRHYRWPERAMWAVAIAGLLVALLAPHWAGPRLVSPFDVGSDLLFAGSIAWFLWRAAQTPRTDYRVLAACLVIPMLASIYGFMSWFGWAPSTQLLRLSQILTSLGIMFALAYRFVAGMRRVEVFNIVLGRKVHQATQRLSQTLAREHALALAKSRAEERLQLARDLHDGFGGTLVGTIARLEQAADDAPRDDVLDTLRELRDDLRLVLDSTRGEATDLVDQLAPLRYRSGQLMEAVGIDSRWHLQALDGIELDGPRSLDLLRLLQEALTNILKHSRARHAEVHLVRDADELLLRVRDDGQGLPGVTPSAMWSQGSTGFANMRLRAQRLGGALAVESGASGTELRVRFPIQVAGSAA